MDHRTGFQGIIFLNRRYETLPDKNNKSELGKIIWYDKWKKIGFLERISGEHAFFHETACIAEELELLEPGKTVEYVYFTSKRGSRAINVRLVNNQ
ncbi:MAG: cold shock domain-containing protein [Candidatus Coatesbacteria bacterium]|nr:cold shock domain-containing protein [Candidatus Coatesbacteria bacterium]